MGLTTSGLNYKKRDRGSWWDFILPLALLATAGFFLKSNFGRLPNPSEWVDHARISIQKHNFSEALSETLKLVDAFPKNHIYLNQAATLYFELGKRDEEAAMLERFFLSAPEPSEACPRLPEAYRAQQAFMKMLDAAKRCLALEPQNSDFLLELGLSFERAGQPQEALEIFQKGAVQFPEYFDFSIGHARVLLHLGETQKAWDEIMIVIKYRPELTDAQEVAQAAGQLLGIDSSHFNFKKSNLEKPQ